MLNPLFVIVITVNVLPKCFFSFNNLLAELDGFCFEANSKILIEFTARKAASAPEQHADPTRIIDISKIKMRTLGSINLGQN